MEKKKTTPLVVANVGWGQTLPEWLKHQVDLDRMVTGFACLLNHKKLTYKEQVRDAEVIAYLYTASLTVPMQSEYVHIYIYLTAKLWIDTKRYEKEQLPDFMKEALDRGLTQDEQRELDDLRRWIYDKRGGDYTNPLIEMLKQLKGDLLKTSKSPKMK